MSTQRKQYSAEFKARVALEGLKGLKTVNELPGNRWFNFPHSIAFSGNTLKPTRWS